MGGVKLNRHHGLPRLPATTNGRRAPSAPAPLVFYRRCVLRIVTLTISCHTHHRTSGLLQLFLALFLGDA